MPAPPTMQGARTLILNGQMQNDLDAQNHKIWNLDTSNLNIGGGPNPFPAVPHEWLNSYDDVSRNFTATQPNILSDLSGFPSIIGHAGQFLGNNGTILKWATPQGQSGLSNHSFLNVKQDPYNAVGDGVTDDYPAISAAIADAAGGLTVYFPKGVYYISQNLTPGASVSLLGDNPFQSVIKGNPNLNGTVLLVPQGSIVQKLGFIGSSSQASQPVPSTRIGLGCSNGNGIYIFQCVVTDCSYDGIAVQFCYGVTIRDCQVAAVGRHGIEVGFSARCLIFGNSITLASLSGIWLTNCPNSAVQNNQVWSTGCFGYGVYAADCDNTLISGNALQQNLIGLGLQTTYTRLAQPQSHGYVVTGNNVMRNYYGGVILTLVNSAQVSSNLFSDNGTGGTDNATYTTEPGICIAAGNRGTGYQVGDILTISGGTFSSPARAIVTRVGTGGAIAVDGLWGLNLGNYTVFPGNPASVTGGHGSGAKVILTSLQLRTGGSGYVVGQVVVSLAGTFYNPVRVLITRVDNTGAVLGFQVLDGGGYFGTLPTIISVFVGDGLSSSSGNPDTPSPSPLPPQPDTGTGLSLLPSFGLRYSQNLVGGTSFNFCTYGALFGGSFNANIMDACRTGVGMLVLDDIAPYNGRAHHLVACDNSLINNNLSIRGKTVGGALDTSYNINSIFNNNLIYPPGT